MHQSDGIPVGCLEILEERNDPSGMFRGHFDVSEYDAGQFIDRTHQMRAVAFAGAVEMQDITASRGLHELLQGRLAVPVRLREVDDELPAEHIDLAQRNRDMASCERSLNRLLAETVLEARPAHVFDHVETELAARRNETVQCVGLAHLAAAVAGPVLDVRMERADVEGDHRALRGLVGFQLAAAGARGKPRLEVELRGDGEQSAEGACLHVPLDRALQFLDQECCAVFFPANAASTWSTWAGVT